MDIFTLLKSLKHSHWYEVPANDQTDAIITVNSHEAGKILKHYWSLWKKQNVNTDFEIGATREFPIWDTMELKIKFYPVCRVKIYRK